MDKSDAHHIIHDLPQVHNTMRSLGKLETSSSSQGDGKKRAFEILFVLSSPFLCSASDIVSFVYIEINFDHVLIISYNLQLLHAGRPTIVLAIPNWPDLLALDNGILYLNV